MFIAGIFAGALLGFLICAIFTVGASTDAWDRGLADGMKLSTLQGKIIARNNDLDEIMVEYGADMARYKRVTGE